MMTRYWHRLGAPVALAAAVTAAGLGLRYRAVRLIAPEMRTAFDWVPLDLRGPRTLAVARRFFVGTSQAVEGVEVVQRSVPGGLDVLLHEPADRQQPSPALLWIHGGGTVAGTPESDRDLCSRLADQLGVLVVSARYRLAPEHPFPAGLDDCHAALRWLLDSSADLGIDRDRIAVGGASAGGLLAASLTHRAIDEGLPVAMQLLVYPMLDDRTATRRALGARGRIAWTNRSNAYGWAAYLGHRAGEVDPRPYAVPARRDDLTAMPPTWIGVGDADLFHDEDLQHAGRLRAAGVDVTVHVVPGMPHGADRTWGDRVEPTRSFIEQMTHALADGLATTPGADAVAEVPAEPAARRTSARARSKEQ